MLSWERFSNRTFKRATWVEGKSSRPLCAGPLVPHCVVCCISCHHHQLVVVKISAWKIRFESDTDIDTWLQPGLQYTFQNLWISRHPKAIQKYHGCRNKEVCKLWCLQVLSVQTAEKVRIEPRMLTKTFSLSTGTGTQVNHTLAGSEVWASSLF